LDTASKDQNSISVAYIDISRAFDSVTHVKLFARLHSYGVQGDLLRWLTEFLQDAHIKLESV